MGVSLGVTEDYFSNPSRPPNGCAFGGERGWRLFTAETQSGAEGRREVILVGGHRHQASAAQPGWLLCNEGANRYA